MANLAILGHHTRRKEVIEIMEMVECLLGKEETMEEINIDRIGFNGDRAKLILPDGYEFKTEGKEVYVVKKKPCKEETNMKEHTKLNLSAIDYNNGLVGYEIPGGYEFDTVIDNKVVIKKLKPKYPTTYEECCGVLGCKADNFFTNFSYNGCDVEISDYEDEIDDLLQNFRRLRYCRDAYWKMAGNEMGLGKPWEPNWLDGEYKWGIAYSGTCIDLIQYKAKQRLLVFPTAEMRDAFYANFKELIEQCKKLL